MGTVNFDPQVLCHEIFHAYEHAMGREVNTQAAEVQARLFATYIGCNLFGKEGWDTIPFCDQITVYPDNGIPANLFNAAAFGIIDNGFSLPDYIDCVNWFSTGCCHGGAYKGIPLGCLDIEPLILNIIPSRKK